VTGFGQTSERPKTAFGNPIGATDSQRLLCAKTELAVTPLTVFEVDVHGVINKDI
jgi:hypothetical protein